MLGLELGQSESRPKIPQRGVSTVKQTLVASHGLQEKSLDESLDRSPFRNLFEGEAHESSRRTVARYPSRKN